MNKDLEYVRKAIDLVKKGGTAVYPNPRVGAIVVEHDKIIARGFHHAYGMPHAEKMAIDKALALKQDEKGVQKLHNATLYCTLEPCSGTWKGKIQAPCTDTILASGIKRVVIAMIDPNPKVNGRGVAILRKAGIEVLLLDNFKEQLIELNEVFIHLQHAKRPFVHAKIAQSLDARIASESGDSKWITGLQSRYIVHTMRKDVQAIITGVNTVLQDDPQFSVRLDTHTKESVSRDKNNNPLLVILDTTLRTPPQAMVFNCSRRHMPGVFIFCGTQYATKKKIERLESQGAKVIVQDRSKDIDISSMLCELYKNSIFSILLESGPNIVRNFFELGLIDKFSVFIAPKIIGGTHLALQTKGSLTMQDVSKLYRVKTQTIRNTESENDILISGYTNSIYHDL